MYIQIIYRQLSLKERLYEDKYLEITTTKIEKINNFFFVVSNLPNQRERASRKKNQI